MSERLDEADHEIRSLLRFAASLGVDGASVLKVYAALCREVDTAGGASTKDRLAEARHRLVRAAG